MAAQQWMSGFEKEDCSKEENDEAAVHCDGKG